MIHATRLFHSLLHFRWILLPPPFIRKQLKMPPREGEDPLLALLNSTCIINSTMVHFINWSSNWMHFPWSRQQQRWIIVNSAEILDLSTFRIFNQSMFQNDINSTNPLVIQCCQLYHNFFKVGNTAFTLIRKEHHHPLLPPQRICSGATLWRQIMTVSSGRDFDQSKASFLRLSCQIGWAKSIFHVDCWL